MSTKVITGKVRFSYAHVHVPTAIQEGDTAKYSVSLIIPKTDTVTINKIKAAIEAAKELGKTSKFGGKIPTVNFKTPLRDGDVERPDDDAYAGAYFVNASTFNKPQIVDAELNEIMSKDEFYSGCYGRASINFYPFAVSGNKGIAAGLNNLQKLEDGESLGGSSASAAAEFGEDAEDLM